MQALSSHLSARSGQSLAAMNLPYLGLSYVHTDMSKAVCLLYMRTSHAKRLERRFLPSFFFSVSLLLTFLVIDFPFCLDIECAKSFAKMADSAKTLASQQVIFPPLLFSLLLF